MRAALFGTYNRDHSANRIAAAAVRAAGYDIVEFHDPLWERTRDKDARYFSPLSLAGLALAWFGSAWRLAGAWRRAGGAPVVVVGFNGQLDVLLLKLLGGRFGPRIVFAPLVSVTETLVDDRDVYREGSLAARLLKALDRATCRAADVVVVDTHAHRSWFIESLGVNPSRLLVCHLGADPEVFLEPDLTESANAAAFSKAAAADAAATANAATLPRAITPAKAGASAEPLDVLWFGQYLPLHGLDVIVDAVGRLAVRDDVRRRLRFTFIGTGEERERVERNLRATRADVHFEDWVAYELLPARIARADIVLGIFGSSQKARMVIPNKVYEAAAVGAAIITSDTPAIREVFEDGRDLLLCPADGLALADAIARMADQHAGPEFRATLSASARRLMLENFSVDALGRAWSVALAGPEAQRVPEAASSSERASKVGVVVLCFQDAARTLECLHSLAGDGYSALDVLVVDNGSVETEARRLVDGVEGKLDAEILRLDRNLGYAGANNLAMKTLFDRGCDHVLLLNSDTRIAGGSIGALVRTAESQRRSGPLGPRVCDGYPGQRPVSLGERYRATFLWAPRSLLRVRRRWQRPYPTSGITGCAFFVPRALYEQVGGFDEKLFAYYEEVDLCLRARAAGFVPTMVPAAEVGHDGARGFASGMTPLAAWLKARNLRLVGFQHTSGVSQLIFAAGSLTMVLASAVLYALRGRGHVAKALVDGMRAAAYGQFGAPPVELFSASGYAGSGAGEPENKETGR